MVGDMVGGGDGIGRRKRWRRRGGRKKGAKDAL